MRDGQNRSVAHQPNPGALAFAAAIEREGLTFREAEQALGLAADSGQITRLTSGERLPGADVSHRIWKRFGVPMHLWREPAAEKGAA